MDKEEITELRVSLNDMTKIMIDFTSLFNELCDLKNSEVDKLFDKYEITIADKYPRRKGGRK